MMPQNAETLSNAEIADRLSALAQLLALEKANPYKIRAYRRAASTIRGLGESVAGLVRSEGDLTSYAGIGTAISGGVREIVLTGTLTGTATISATLDGISGSTTGTVTVANLSSISITTANPGSWSPHGTRKFNPKYL